MPPGSVNEDMGARRHGEEGALAPPPLWKYGKVFCALVFTAKRSVDESFMHYFHNLSSASGCKAPRPPGLHLWTPLSDFRLQNPNLLTPGKNPVDAHE